MKKLCLFLAFASSAAIAQPTADQAISIFNSALTSATKSLPKERQEAFGNSQIAFNAWAQQDCKARLGLPQQKDASLNDPAFGACMADQLLRRADQLKAFVSQH